MQVAFMDGVGDETNPKLQSLLRQLKVANQQAAKIMRSLSNGRRKGKKVHKASVVIRRITALAREIETLSGGCKPWHFNEHALASVLQGKKGWS